MSEGQPTGEDGPAWTRDVARYGAQARFEDLPSAVVDRAKTVLLDTLTAALAGQTLPAGRYLLWRCVPFQFCVRVMVLTQLWTKCCRYIVCTSCYIEYARH